MKKCKVSILFICFMIMILLIGCSSNENSEQPENDGGSNDIVETTSTVTWESFKAGWANSMPIDELKVMEEMDLDQAIRVPNVKRNNTKFSEYLFLASDVNETTDEIIYLYMLGKYHQEIYENQVRGFNSMISLMNPNMKEESVNQLLNDLGLDPTSNPSLGSTTRELEGYEYVATFDNEGVVQLEMTSLNDQE